MSKALAFIAVVIPGDVYMPVSEYLERTSLLH